MPTSLDEIIAQEQSKTEYRKTYNKKPEVVTRRKLYNKFRQEEAKIARQVINGDLTMREGENALTNLKAEYETGLKQLKVQAEPVPTIAQPSEFLEDAPETPKQSKQPRKRNNK